MKAIVHAAAGHLELRDLPVPQPGEGEVRIRTTACGIGARDLALIAGWPRDGLPWIYGREWAGVVDAVGPDIPKALLGRTCTGENWLPIVREIGVDAPGGFAERFIARAEKLHTLPGDYPPTSAAQIEPLAVGVKGMRALKVEDKSSALVVGDGSMGLLMVSLLRDIAVRRIVLLGGRPWRLDMGRRVGAMHVFDRHAGGLPAGEVFPIVIEASGTAAGVEAALAAAAGGGRVLVIGNRPGVRAGPADRGVTVAVSTGSQDAWIEAVRLAVEGGLFLNALVSHRLPPDRFREALDLARGRGPGIIKVMIEWGTAQ
ncbi:MAG: alcohol dehydrogenase catalytic domain-containing protein [Candidatus Coatesbacteria bacterium]